jgi:hypothetical protein
MAFLNSAFMMAVRRDAPEISGSAPGWFSHIGSESVALMTQ